MPRYILTYFNTNLFQLLRYEYEQMLTQTNVPGWANDTHWVAHPVTNIPDSEFVSLSSGTPVKKKKARRNKKDDLQDVKLHKSGCARTEGICLGRPLANVILNNLNQAVKVKIETNCLSIVKVASIYPASSITLLVQVIIRSQIRRNRSSVD